MSSGSSSLQYVRCVTTFHMRCVTTFHSVSQKVHHEENGFGTSSSSRRRPSDIQLSEHKQSTLNVASGSVARQPGMRQDPSSTLYIGEKLLPRELVQPWKSGAHLPLSVVAVAS